MTASKTDINANHLTMKTRAAEIIFLDAKILYTYGTVGWLPTREIEDVEVTSADVVNERNVRLIT